MKKDLFIKSMFIAALTIETGFLIAVVAAIFQCQSLCASGL